MKPPRKAFVLAAGLGTRLRPLTFETPKPLLPLWGRPLLERTLDLLAGWGVQEALINLHHGAAAIVRQALERRRGRLRLAFSFEPEPLGTGGALARAAWFINEPFWLINGDIAAVVSPAPFLRAVARGAWAAVWLTDAAGPRTVETRRGFVRDFRSPNAGRPGTGTFCGLHLLRPDVLRFIPPRGFSTIIQAYEAALRRGCRIAAVTPAGA